MTLSNYCPLLMSTLGDRLEALSYWLEALSYWLEALSYLLEALSYWLEAPNLFGVGRDEVGGQRSKAGNGAVVSLLRCFRTDIQ